MRTNATLLALLTLPWCAACGGGEAPVDPPPAPEDRTSVVLVTLDTTRADSLSYLGQVTVGLTPHLDGLAARGLTHLGARTVAPLTLPSHASMLTGLYPPRHGIRDNGQAVLPQTAETLAEAARAAGYRTGAFLAAAVLDASFGLDQGFETYTSGTPATAGASTHVASRPGSEVVDEALAWLDGGAADEPFFLWVHLFEPHDPYEPAFEYRLRSGSDAYLAEVSQADAEIGRLLERLEAPGLAERTAVLFLSDHGEARGDHDEETHGAFTYESVLRVPFILARPDGARAGEYSTAPVSVVDVAPTLADAMGLTLPDDLDGVSLWDADPPVERGVYFECMSGYLSLGWSPLVGWVDARGKYHHSSSPELYDLTTDPGETANLATQRDVSPWRDAIARLYERPRLLAEGNDVDQELLAKIRALGYAGTGASGELPHPLEASDLPSPHRRARELGLVLRGNGFYGAGKLEEAILDFRAVIQDNPRSLRALEGLTNCLMLLERRAEAVEPLRQRIALDGGRGADHWNLGLALAAAGEGEAALESFVVAATREDRDPSWVPFVRNLLVQAGRPEEAARLPGGGGR